MERDQEFIIYLDTHINWTRDPFDRLIAAEVMLYPDALLVTKDSMIREYFDRIVK